MPRSKTKTKKENQHPEIDLKMARDIILDELAGYRANVYLFGSRATGNAASTSDIDIALLPEEALPDGLLAKIREQLENSRIIYEVDLVDLSQAGETLRERVEKEGIQWTA